MAKEFVLIGCRLPHGLVLRHPSPEHKDETVTLEGLKDSKVIGATYVTTKVDAEFWATWKTAYSDFQPLRTGAIFEARSDDEAKFKAKSLTKEKTGFEPMKPEDGGVKPAEKDAK